MKLKTDFHFHPTPTVSIAVRYIMVEQICFSLCWAINCSMGSLKVNSIEKEINQVQVPVQKGMNPLLPQAMDK